MWVFDDLIDFVVGGFDGHLDDDDSKDLLINWWIVFEVGDDIVRRNKEWECKSCKECKNG